MAQRLEDAISVIEVCRSVLSQEGQHTAVEALRGVEITSPATAGFVCGMLRAIPVYGAIANAVKSEAIHTLEQVSAPS